MEEKNEEKEWLEELVSEKINEVFLAYQEKEGITDGGIEPWLEAITLENIIRNVADFVVESMKDAPREKGV